MLQCHGACEIVALRCRAEGSCGENMSFVCTQCGDRLCETEAALAKHKQTECPYTFVRDMPTITGYTPETRGYDLTRNTPDVYKPVAAKLKDFL
eukprot:g48625.t1